MAAIIPSYIFLLFHCNPISLHFQQQMHDSILSFASITLSLFCFILFSFSIYKKVSKTEEQHQKGQTQNPEQFDPSLVKRSLSQVVDEVRSSPSNSPTHLSRSLLLEVLPSDSTKWASLFDDKGCDDPKSISPGLEGGRGDSGEEQRGKKKKRKAKKKKKNSIGEDSAEEKGGEREKTGLDSGVRLESVCLYPFTSSSSAMQRKIKQQYDGLVKCHESKKLTLAQVFLF